MTQDDRSFFEDPLQAVLGKSFKSSWDPDRQYPVQSQLKPIKLPAAPTKNVPAQVPASQENKVQCQAKIDIARLIGLSPEDFSTDAEACHLNSCDFHRAAYLQARKESP